MFRATFCPRQNKHHVITDTRDGRRWEGYVDAEELGELSERHFLQQVKKEGEK